ncbi:hypothetical protein BKA93DRAFT_574852 [Sparassis latifolia]
MSDTSQFEMNIAYDILCSIVDHPTMLSIPVRTGMQWAELAAEIAQHPLVVWGIGAPLDLYKLRAPTPEDELQQGLQIGGVEDIADKVRSFAEVPHDMTQFPRDKVHVVVVVSPPRKIAEELPRANQPAQQQSALVKLLQVVVEIPNKWSMNDVINNGGVFLDRSHPDSQNMVEIVSRLKAKRTYQTIIAPPFRMPDPFLISPNHSCPSWDHPGQRRLTTNSRHSILSSGALATMRPWCERTHPHP